MVLKINESAPGGSTGQANFSFDDQVVELQGGGYWGWISPARRPAHDPIFEDVAYILALVNLMGCQLLVQSKPGKGTRVIIQIPAQFAKA